jgi:hypothetical protein
MEWILVISVIALFPADLRIPDSRTRGLTEAACMALAGEVQSRKTITYCYEDGTPDPGRQRATVKERPICDECGPLPGRRRV